MVCEFGPRFFPWYLKSVLIFVLWLLSMRCTFYVWLHGLPFFGILWQESLGFLANDAFSCHKWYLTLCVMSLFIFISQLACWHLTFYIMVRFYSPDAPSIRLHNFHLLSCESLICSCSFSFPRWHVSTYCPYQSTSMAVLCRSGRRTFHAISNN